MSDATEEIVRPGDNVELVLEWAADWADTFDQSWDEAALAGFVGKTVVATDADPEGTRGFTKTIVGYSRDVLLVGDREVFRSSFITAEGTQVALFTDMRVEEFSE